MTQKKHKISNIYPLTPLQEGLLIHQLRQPTDTAYVDQYCMVMKGKNLETRLKEGFTWLIARHDVLRTVFVHDKSPRPLQVVLSEVAPGFKFENLIQLNEIEQKAKTDLFKIQNRQQGFDLRKSPPIRMTVYQVEAEVYEVIFIFHHILLDGWSVALMIKELVDFMEGNASKLPLPVPFNHYLKWLENQNQAVSLKYWKTYLSGFHTLTGIPQQPTTNQGISEFRFELEEVLSKDLVALASQAGVTLFTLIQSLWAVVLARYNNETEVIFGTVASGRNVSLEGVERMVGLLINTLPIRVTVPDKLSFLAFLEKNGNAQIEQQSHQFCSLAEIKKLADVSELFDHLLVFENYPHSQKEASKEAIAAVQSVTVSDETEFPFTLNIHKEDKFYGRITYKKNCFAPGFIGAVAQHLKQVARTVVKMPNILLQDIHICDEKEQTRILKLAIGEVFELPKACTLLDKFDELLASHSIKELIGFDHQYHDLNTIEAQSNQIAWALIERGIKKGDIVGLSCKRSIAMVCGVLGIWKAGAAYLPIGLDYPAERRNYIVEHAQIPLLLTDADLGDSPIKCLTFEEVWASDYSMQRPANRIASTDVAYVIYTSGSTGNPKGVMIEHHSAINRMQWMGRFYDINSADIILQKTPFTFDVSVWELTLWMFTGTKLYFANPGAEKDPIELIRTIESQQITTMHFVPSMLRIFLDFVSELDCSNRLISLKKVFASGEALLPQDVEQFYQLVPNAQLHNLYGPTEATVDVSYYACPDKEIPRTIPIGKPIDNTQLYILNRQQQLQPLYVSGELFIAGVNVGRGYLNAPQLTEERFLIDPFLGGNQKMYKTGDLARLLPDGNIEYLGRNDHQVKLRGFRIELPEIEFNLQQHPQIKESRVAVREGSDGDKELIGFYRAPKALENAELKQHLKQSLPDYMVPAAFFWLKEFPLNSSGKTDLKALLRQVESWVANSSSLEKPTVVATTETEEKLIDIFSKILGKKDIIPTANFFEIGGHSLKAIRTVALIYKTFGQQISIQIFFENPCIRDLAAILDNQTTSNQFQLIPIQEHQSDIYDCSFAQNRMLTLEKIHGGHKGYHMPGAYWLQGSLDIPKLKAAFKTLSQQQKSLRTVFGWNEEKQTFYQHILPQIDLPFEVVDARKINDGVEDLSLFVEKVFSEFIRPFDLEEGPLVRIKIYKVSEKNHLLLTDFHHIISDGSSSEFFTQQLIRLYLGEQLPSPEIQYKDFSIWQNEQIAGGKFEEAQQFWKNHLLPLPNHIELPYDFRRPPEVTQAGATFDFELNEVLTAQLKKQTLEGGGTLFMSLLSAYYLLLNKFSGNESIIVGVPVSGRDHPQTNQIIGLFVNTIALKIDFQPNKTFWELTQQVKEISLKGLTHQSYPFDLLTTQLELDRDLSRNPIFDVFFAYQNFDQEKEALPDTIIKKVELPNQSSLFDLSLFGVEEAGKIKLGFEYSTDLFKETTIQRLAKAFVKIIETAVAHPVQELKAISVLTEEDSQKINQFNQQECAFPATNVSQLLLDSFQKNKTSTAIKFGTETWTYGELYDKAAAIATELKKAGVAPNDVVGVLCDTSFELIAGLIGTLLSSAAFVPLDPAYPLERLLYMLEDSGAKIILTTSDLKEKLPFEGDIILLDKLNGGADSEVSLKNGNQPEDLFYIIYTSGSTGKPKGVMLEHRNIVNHYFHEVTQGNNFACKTLQYIVISFDMIFYDIFCPLLAGGTTYLIPKDRRADISWVFDHARREGIERWCLPTAFIRTMMNEDSCYENFPDTIKYILVAGEQLIISDRFKRFLINRNILLYNYYGPSETHAVTHYDVPLDASMPSWVPIGVPLSNCKIHILDALLTPVPIGVKGEIFIGGAQVGRGYINKEKLTQERFINNPFGKGRLYKTGDLGKWTEEGNVVYMGRNDFQLKIRGNRVEIGEVEAVLKNLPHLLEVAVIGKKDRTGTDHLIAFYSGEKFEDIGELKERLNAQLPDYMVPQFFEWLEELPKLPNGKVNRKILSESQLTQKINQGSSAVAIPQWLIEIWKEVLETETVTADSHFFNAGGHSLKATSFSMKVQRKSGLELPVKQIFKTPKLATIYQFIASKATIKTDIIPLLPKADQYQTSKAQQRLIINYQVNPTSSAYNIITGFEANKALNLEALKKTLQHLVNRYEILRTAFEISEPPFAQIIQETIPLPIIFEEASTADADQMGTTYANRPFDITVAPLFKVLIIKMTDTNGYRIILIMHHLITDGWSLRLLLKELSEAYHAFDKGNTPVFASLPIQYKEFAHWQNERFHSGYFDKLGAYWKNRLTGYPDYVPLPYDFSRPPIFDSEGRTINSFLEKALLTAIDEAAKNLEITRYHFLFAAYFVFLQRLSNHSKIIVGTALAGRIHPDLERIQGFFVNTLPIAAHFEKGITFDAFAKKVSENIINDLDSQEMSFEEIVHLLELKRNPSYTPLFQVHFVYNDFYSKTNTDSNDRASQELYTELHSSKFDFTFMFQPHLDGLGMNLNYRTSLFKKTTSQWMIEAFRSVLQQACNNHSLSIHKFKLLEKPKQKKKGISLLKNIKAKRVNI